MAYNVNSWRTTKKQKSKYSNKFTDYDGHRYHSKFESKVAQDLDLKQKAGIIRSWERQKRIDLRVDGKHICNYYIDFVVYHTNDTVEYIEVKGYETDVWRIKWRLFEVQMNRDEPDSILTIMKR